MTHFPSVKTGSIELLFRDLKQPELGQDGYSAAGPHSQTFQPGYRKTQTSKPFTVETIWERDIDIPLRDGVKLKADVFRPANCTTRLPAILPWSPYGKDGRGIRQQKMPGRLGIPDDGLSGYEKFEAPDPAEWTARGYAVVNIDSRGAWDSEGYLCWAGTQEGRDGYDAIEFIAKLPWCNGSVATAGNSWLGRAQWYIAAEQPPSLKCIAPLEGSGDLYREIHVRGGIACTPFLEWMMSNFRGRGAMEDPVQMLKRYPLMNEYWEDKRANISRIQVPAYILASYSTFLHLPGSLRGYEEMCHSKKWLRIHESQEWHDLYQTSTNDDLQKFFDRYCKGIENDWEATPKVRVSLIGFNQPNIKNRVFDDWPIPETKYETLYLGPNEQMRKEPWENPGIQQYKSDEESYQMDNDPEELVFRFELPERRCQIGSVKAILYMSCDEFDDMDIFLQIRKADSTGRILQSHNVPLKDMERQGVDKENIPLTNTFIYLGPHGQIRASHRKIDQGLSKPHYILHEHISEERILPGTVVKIETSIWPGGFVLEKGEYLIFKVSGHPMYLAEFPTLRGQFKARNKGLHKVHLGGAHGSHLVVPFVEA